MISGNRSRLAQALGWLPLQIAITLLILAALELTARIYLYATGAYSDEDPRVHADAYAHDPWAKEGLQEYAALSVQWHPYSYWVGSPYRTRYTNIDTNGIRATWRGPAACAPNQRPMEIFMFGGSTMWGDGVRDDSTIASLMQRMLAERHACAHVTNLGQDGYVSTQERIYLENQIQKGHVPLSRDLLRRLQRHDFSSDE